MKKECKTCGLLVEHILDKVYPCGIRRYVNKAGNQWKGKRCPNCAKKHHRVYQRDKYGKQSLKNVFCPACGKLFKQKQGRHLACSIQCRWRIDNWKYKRYRDYSAKSK